MDSLFRRAAFQATDTVRRLDYRSNIAEALRSAQLEQGGRLGYTARRQRAQFLGFLLAHEQRGRLPPELRPEPMSPELRGTIARAHGLVVQANAACLSRIAHHAAYAALACDPYEKFPRVEFDDSCILPEDVLRELGDAISRAPAFQLLRSTRSGVPPEAVRELSLFLEETLFRLGAEETPRELLNLLEPPLRTNAQALTVLAIGALALRNSIYVLDQLVFQAFLGDRLFTLDESNVFARPATRRHRGGVGHIVEFVPTVARLMPEPGEVVVLGGDNDGATRAWTEFCQVGQVTLSMSQDSGAVIRAHLRELDENATVFGGLVSVARDLVSGSSP